MSRPDIHGRRGGRWAAQEPGEALAAFAEYRRTREADEADEAAAEAARKEYHGDQLELFG